MNLFFCVFCDRKYQNILAGLQYIISAPGNKGFFFIFLKLMSQILRFPILIEQMRSSDTLRFVA